MKKKNAEPLADPVLIDDQDLPEGWTKKTLLEVAGGEPRLVVGGPFGSCLKVDDYQKMGIPIIRLQNVGHAKFVDKDIKYLTLEKAKELEYHTFVKGDLVLAKLGDPIGKTCIIPDKFEWGIVVSDVVRIRLENDQIDKKYLLYYLNSSHSISQINSQVFGSTRPRVNLKEVRDIVILVPPLAEQHRIVARVEALLSHVNAARERLSRVPLIMKKFRQAVLAAACSGRLTEGWRKENDVDETGNQLFDRIQKEREILFDDEISLAKTQNRHPQYKKPEFLGQPDDEKLSKLFDLPEEWICSKLGNLGEIVRGASPRPAGDPKYFGGDVPWITVGEITKDENPYLTTVSEYLTKQGQEKSRTIPVDTLLLTNSGATLGVPKITRIEGCINDGSVAILSIPFTSKLYLYYFLKSQTKALREINQGMGQPNLNTDIVREIVIPLPPLAEQHEIVHRVGLLFERADAFDQEVVAASRRCERLTQAVLGKAFTGKM